MRLGTRGSQLAQWQVEWVRARLAAVGVDAEIVIIKTRGDAEVDRPLHELEGKGFFTKEIEDALLAGHIDVAVHSLKDLPTELPKGLALAAVPARHDPREALVGGASLRDLPQGARVGTSSLRRVTQVRYLRPDLEVVSLRGNVPTRVRKVESHDGCDAALLALAGLERLSLGRSATPIDPLEVMPAPGQGALGLEIRADDRKTRDTLTSLGDAASERAVQAERALLAALGGGCQAPVAAWVDARQLFGRVTASDGAVQLTASAEIDCARPQKAGEAVARLLEAAGAASLLAR
ncbi:MAG TPA: hydroxymethylbilane synthase [Gemmatimonadales bacterium]|jgi:hydroxymethylbilane synthase|nr:hydroxymethylbilane synthase [Gemmatimonadales bacterium]